MKKFSFEKYSFFKLSLSWKSLRKSLFEPNMKEMPRLNIFRSKLNPLFDVRIERIEVKRPKIRARSQLEFCMK